MNELEQFVLQNEASLRLGFFVSLLISFLFLETLIPRRSSTRADKTRWLMNTALMLVNTITIRLIFPMAAVGVAWWAQEQNYGLLSGFEAQPILQLIAGFLLLDFCIYWQHRIFHVVPLFWRLHRLHHSDLEFDVTTAVRFHPVEIVLSMLIKSIIIIAIGITPLTVILFEIVLSSTALFNHSNIKLPQSLDNIIRLILVTPDMHRIHHSITKNETNSNYGFNIPWWDHLFGSYTAAPNQSHELMPIGLEQFRDRSSQKLIALLKQPFNNDNEKRDK